MEIVQPIRESSKIKEIEQILKSNNLRDYFLFRIGIYSGLRISDILKLRVSDLFNQEYFILREQKTNKFKRLKIHSDLKEELNIYLNDKPIDSYIFKSQKNTDKSIQRVQAYRILNDAAHKVGLDEIGTHTLRKTFGYHFYKGSNNLTLLQKIFNHSSSDVTLRYIGILQDDMDDAIDSLEF